MRRKLEYLSARQQEILACIRRWIVEHGEAPTVREIARTVGLSSTSSVAYQLEERGEITRGAVRPPALPAMRETGGFRAWSGHRGAPTTHEPCFLGLRLAPQGPSRAERCCPGK
ncbi:LexA family protein [Streptomyces avermitilis]|uniref:LexA family protein n=1 Tax=Streptomyces avermitilis TaxID=33903 RepID=UPI00380D70CE